MSFVWLLRLKGHKRAERVYGPDLMLAVCQRSLVAGWRHFFYGGAPGVAQELAESLSRRCPGLQIAGTWTPPFRPLTEEEDQRIVKRLESSGADIVWLGISTPKQERWMAEHVGKVGVPVLIGVGAAFDFLSGRKLQALVWIHRGGLEWMYRLIGEPRCLWPRYKQYPKFVWLAMQEFPGRSVSNDNGSRGSGS